MIIRDYLGQLYTNKLNNPEKKMTKFLEIYKLPRQNDQEIHLKRIITSNEIESVIKQQGS